MSAGPSEPPGAVADTGARAEPARMGHANGRSAGSSRMEVIDAWRATDPTVRDRVSAITQLTSTRHPHVAAIEDAGAWSQGCLYIASEPVMGRLLSAVIAEHAPLGTDDAIAIVLQIVLGVEHLHAREMSPLALHPDAIAVDANSHVTLLAASLLPPPPDVELYRAPEEINGAPSGQQADVYRLGLIAYELLSGRQPFSGTGDALIEEQLHTAPPPLIGFNRDLPGAVVRAVQRALAKQPASRPASAAAFADILCGAAPEAMGEPAPSPEPSGASEAVGESAPEAVEAVVATQEPAAAPLDEAEMLGEQAAEPAAQTEATTAARRRWRRGLWLGLALLAVVIAAAAATLLIVRAQHSTTSAVRSSPAAAGATTAPVAASTGGAASAAVTAAALATATPPPTVSELTVCDDVFACQQTDFVASGSLAICFVLTPAPGGLALEAAITAGNSQPTDANAPQVIARSAPIAGADQRSCYLVALPAALPPGSYTAWVLDGSQVLGQRSFTTIAP